MTTPLRIGTWNVEYATVAKNPARLARLMQADADVWVLTETHDALSLASPYAAASTCEQRSTGRPGARWTTIWSRWPMVAVTTDDTQRTVAARIQAPGGDLLVFGTVLPWGTDPGPDPAAPARGWTEMDRVFPLQLAEWRRLREAHGVPLVVAGDLNMDLGGAPYYGTKRCRAALSAGLAELQMRCATSTDQVPPGKLEHPPIDHVLVPAGWTTRVAEAWEGTQDGVRLSDHSGLVVEVSARR